MSLTLNFFRTATRNSHLIKLTRTALCQSKSINLVRASVSRNVERPCSVFTKSPEYSQVAQLDLTKFESECKQTLETLTEYFDEIVENDAKLSNPDVAYSDGVLTVKLGTPHGTYVINRQTPNRQIWLSSPTSGPKRYDFIEGKWIYKHDGVSLHQLLQNELEQIFTIQVDFLKLAA